MAAPVAQSESCGVRHSTGLLVSVRSAAEARVALAGGVSLIDVKEPSRGSLGRADAATVAEIVRVVAGRCPVSAALGELADTPEPLPVNGLRYAKWGLAGLGAALNWQARLAAGADALHEMGCAAVAVGYADWQRADAPAPVDVLETARSVLLVDTFRKDGSTLLDWLSLAELGVLRAACRARGIRIALAGSLGSPEIEALRDLRPDWFAVRGAVCRRGERDAELDLERITALGKMLSR